MIILWQIIKFTSSYNIKILTEIILDKLYVIFMELCMHESDPSSSPFQDPGCSMSQVVGLLSNSYKPLTHTAWVRARLCKLQKRCTRPATASDKLYQLLALGRWFSPGTLASSITKAVRHDIAEILLKVALNTKNQIKASNPPLMGSTS